MNGLGIVTNLGTDGDLLRLDTRATDGTGMLRSVWIGATERPHPEVADQVTWTAEHVYWQPPGSEIVEKLTRRALSGVEEPE